MVQAFFSRLTRSVLRDVTLRAAGEGRKIHTGKSNVAVTKYESRVANLILRYRY